MPRSRYRFTDPHCLCFMTATINNWLPVFTRPETVNIILDSWRYLQEKHSFQLYGYVILENHIHLVVQSPSLSKDMQRFKSYTAKQVVDHLKACLCANNIQNCVGAVHTNISVSSLIKEVAMDKVERH